MQCYRNFARAWLDGATLQHRARQLLDKKRHAGGAFDNRLYTFAGEGLACRHQGYHLFYIARAQPVERDLRVMRAHWPLRTELGASRAYQHQWYHHTLLGQKLVELQSRWIEPVEVFEDHHNGLQLGRT